MDRDFDIVLWGATGYTGALVAEYLTRGYGIDQDLRWTIAGRNEPKLTAVRDTLATIDPAAANLELLLGDSHDADSLRAMAERARVICTTVGPYTLHGLPLVEVCADTGTHYCDLTGESPFIRRCIDSFHHPARSSGARIVHCCGFDSIPSDLGTQMVVEHMRDVHGRDCDRVRLAVRRMGGAMSGGTVASMAAVIESAGDKGTRRILFDPYSLNPEGEREGPDKGDQLKVRWDEDIESWTAPFLMEGINSRVVRRSNALLGWAWGRDFKYGECVSTGKGPKGWMRATGLAAGLGALAAGLSAPPTRKLLRSFVLPDPGEGPTPEQREAGSFEVHLHGISKAAPGESPVHTIGVVAGDLDPGYGQTAVMLGESAVCLAKDELSSEGGILTPAAAMGPVLTERLRAAGMRFEVSEQGG